jgi:hypothetical protein
MKSLLLFFLFLLPIGIFAQHDADTISMIKKGGTYKFYQQNKEVRFVDLAEIIKENPEATKNIRLAKNNRTFSNIFLGLGIITFGYGVLSGLSATIEEGESSQLVSGTVAGIAVGGALIVLSIPMRVAYKKKTRTAIDLYNQEKLSSTNRNAKLQFGSTQYGLGLTVHF